MDILKIDGKTIDNVTGYKIDIEPIGDWERNAEGKLVGDLLGYKTKINLQIGLVDGSTYKKILQSAKGTFFLSVEYLDPTKNALSIGTFYASPRSGTLALSPDNSEVFWKDVAFNLIER